MQGRSCLLCFETVLGMNKITPTTSPRLTPPKKKFPKFFFQFNDILRNFFKGVGVSYLFFKKYQIAHTLLGRSCILCFENVLGINKITPTPFPPPKNKKVFQKNFFNLMIFLKNLFKGVGLATLSLINYNIARGLLGRTCLKYFNKIKKRPLPLLHRKKISKIPKIYFFVCDDFF